VPDSADKTGERKRSGRVRHDAGGRAIWEWAVESGRHAIDSTSRLLKKLNISDLSLVGDDEIPGKGSKDASKPVDQPDAAVLKKAGAPPRTGLAVKPERAESFDPYNSRSPTGRGIAAPPRPRAPDKPRITQPAKPVKQRGLLARLLGRK
jgi:hypothetical protein